MPLSTGNKIDVQEPYPSNQDSIYEQDIDVGNSDIGNFSGCVTDLFDSLKTVITDSTSNNPKILKIWFNRSIKFNSIGFGCDDLSKSFSNIVIKALGSGEEVRYTNEDFKNDNTKRNSLLISTPPLAANGVIIEFHTTDEICLSNIIIFKATDTNSRILAVSELTGEVENINSFRGALNVTDPLVHKLGVNEYFIRELGTNTTLAVATSIGDTSFTVVSSTGFVTGNKIRVTQNGTAEIGVIFITNVVGNVITIDRPLANAFPIGTNVKLIENNMTSAIGTLASPISYRVAPPAGQIWQITRVLISMTDNTAMDDDKFGSLPPLTNGAVGRAETIGGRIVNITNWKDNSDLVNDMYDINYPVKTPAGTYALRGRWTFTNAQFIVELNGDDGHFIEVLIQDDLTAMASFTIKAQGRIFGG